MKPAKPTPTSASNIQRINAMVDLLQPLIVNLGARWQDESDYEDIADYEAVVRKELPAEFVIVKMTKCPFGFHFTLGTEAEYAVFVSASEYGWKRVA